MEDNRKYIWHKIAETIGELVFSSHGLLQIQVADKEICLAKVKGHLYACSSRCPHAGGLMAQGIINAFHQVVCPLHRYTFDLRNGRNVSGEGYHLKTYPLRQNAEGIFIGITKSGMAFW